ncbi:MAG: non-canonical purine NTP pyrophosphatase, RdgB/HAM1 family [Verrucomicrobia bacterium]|nr:MAG: non-canonical purine NTP pyrophosphatase, RdgB/HAM1 family [Verrucomicrobiota bacterium]PYL62300.1 MAG: non-canonical purine NTP pyrophosphatase, RdgB/HAM1 family [Verrucomicrobiota bacterium]
MQLIVATRNAHKTREIQRILGPAFMVTDLSAHPEIPDIRENGKSFEENAILKAVGASRHLPGFIVADDSGLEVDALGGAPGIFSARYAGENATDKQNIERLLGELARTVADETKRSAQFRCAIALARKGELLGTFEGIVEGIVVERARGLYGFGYDPIFVPRGFQETFAELPAEVKDTISHRAKAIRGLNAKLAALKTAD